jgi:2-dehydropantoate 2-reductase
LGATSAVLGLRFAQVVDDPKARKVVLKVMKECFDTAAAPGITIKPFQGKNFVTLFDFNGPIKKWIAYQLLRFSTKKNQMGKASILQDLEAGKKTEIDSLNGIICSYGERYNIPTPFCRLIVQLCHQIEDRDARPDMQNLARFDEINDG